MPARDRRLPRQPALDPGALAALGAPCPPQGCPIGLVCVEYCGVAGCRAGSVFHTCEIPCKDSARCPEGLVCGNVSDGPGRVCRRGWHLPPPGPRGGELE